MAAEPAVDVGAELRQMDADTLKAMHARLGAPQRGEERRGVRTRPPGAALCVSWSSPTPGSTEHLPEVR